MRRFHFKFFLILFLPFTMHAQTLDTLVDVGGYRMHFKIIKGEGTPILFESGADSDGTVWDHLLNKIHTVTGTTLITYDRSGFGKSEVNPSLKNDSDFGIINGIKELETGLSKLGYNKDLILVPHSYGGFYTQLYASRHPDNVKYIIRIDANLVAHYTDEVLQMMGAQGVPPKTPETLGSYYLGTTYPETVKLLRTINFPSNVPVIDITSPINRGFPDFYWTLVQNAHKNFVDAESNRVQLIAEGSGHNIHLDNPGLVINAIIKAYAQTLNENDKNVLLEKALDNAIVLAIAAKKTETENKHSESDLNDWAYTFLRNEESEKALAIFKLNTMLFPDSFNAFDSYGEALLLSNNKPDAIKMYEKSIALNPENENGKAVLLKIKRE
ncbi:alpha/beta fold hydrolase [Cellulophaga baltica]|uniref:Pimeloyl-ACP methyl ester carboxylesterase n=1 Tax=Cellulophaga baltica TaxID=76594 RepID=A0A1G7L7Z2_9FLAO|nr:alpha/beta hydrolase [Cellulophaga baltica]SDF45511.1 Pimeloyl-ACP methyl ester carboxylesterase [Cellulophaga baltica]